MALYISDTIGSRDDRIRLILNGDEILIAESWDHVDGIMEQPTAWSMRLGWGDIAAAILRKYKKGQTFQIYVGDALQGTGRIDKLGASQPPGEAATVTIGGRDMLARLHDAGVIAQQSFKDVTYLELVTRALEAVGFKSPKIAASNAANRQVKAGVPVTQVAAPRTVDQVLQEGVGFVTGVVTQELQAKVSETWHQFIRRYLDRAGLFLWCAADGTFVLSEPNGKQAPLYQIIRRRGDPNKQANVLGMDFEDDATQRHTEAIIYGRGGGKRHGPAKAKGSFSDDEMLALGYDQPIAFKDANVHNDQEAAFFARRKLAEERRSGYRLIYTLSGLRLPTLASSGTAWAVVTPDTVVSVDDEELGIKGDFYIESVRRQRSPQTTTTVRLMRLIDLVFGSDENDEPGGGGSGGGSAPNPAPDGAPPEEPPFDFSNTPPAPDDNASQ